MDLVLVYKMEYEFANGKTSEVAIRASKSSRKNNHQFLLQHILLSSNI